MINIVTALACEANPIIQRYGLKKSLAFHSFPLYESDSMKLIISGMGKFASASAVGYLQSSLQHATDETLNAAPPHVWFNVGIAGHKSMDIGQALLAHKISEPDSDRSFYPCFTFDVPCTTGEVITVDKAEIRYPAGAAYDMEALGFCAAASLFSSFEQIHCLKIISDNESVSQQKISKHLGEELVANQLPIIEVLVSEFFKIQTITAKIHSQPDDYRFLTEQYHFTATQQRQLKRLLQRWRVLTGTRLDDEMDIGDLKSAKQVLLAIEARLQSIAFAC